MISIRLNNSFSNMVGAFPATYEHVKSALTYKDEEVAKERFSLIIAMKKAHAMKNMRYVLALKKRMTELGPEYRCWLDEDAYFPTGILFLVEQALNQIGQRYTIIDDRTKPEPYLTLRWNNKPADLRYYQKEALEAGIDKGRGVFEMSVGSGKTNVAIYLTKELGVNTLFIVPSSALLTQTYDRFVNAFGSKNVQKISTKDVKSKKALKPIRIATIQTLASIRKQGLIENITRDIDMMICDEVHHAGSDSFTGLLPYIQNIYYRFGLSGTYLRNDSKTMDLWACAGEKLYEYSAKKATDEGFLTPVEFNILQLDGSMSNNYHTEYKTNYSSIELFYSIHETLKKINTDSQVLILVDRKERCGDILFEFLKTQGYQDISYVNGDDSKDDIKAAIEDFNDKKIRILIGSTIFGEGCDITSTDHLILARGGKSEISITQAIGRAIRLYPGKDKAYVWDHNFRYTRFLSKHSAQRIDIFDKQFSGKINVLG